jgi:hypothetical protein
MEQKRVSMYYLTAPKYYIIYTENMIPGTKTITQLKILTNGINTPAEE